MRFLFVITDSSQPTPDITGEIISSGGSLLSLSVVTVLMFVTVCFYDIWCIGMTYDVLVWYMTYDALIYVFWYLQWYTISTFDKS
jgi:hypothetical protein